MDSAGGVKESVDFDFFDTSGPTSPHSPKPSTSKPPVRPRTAKPTSSNNDAARNDTKVNENARKRRSPSLSGSSRDSSPEYSTDSVSSSDDSRSRGRSKEQGGKPKRSPSKSSGTVSSCSNSRSPSFSESDRSRSRSVSDSRSKSYSGSNSKANKNRYSSDSDSDHRPVNPIAKDRRPPLPKRGRSRQGEDDYSSSAYSDGDDTTTKNSLCEDGGDRKRVSKTGKNKDKRQAWGDEESGRNGQRKQGYRDSQKTSYRPKTAKSRTAHSSDKLGHSRSDSFSDSDITDVSPIESPRNGIQGKKGNYSQMNAAGDGSSVRKQYQAMPLTDLDVSGEIDHDRHSGLDLEILMKAVGELEKQKRLQANSRRVMFAPMTLKHSDTSNYTFDQRKTMDIERENQRLLKEIVRRVHSGDQRKNYYSKAPNSYKLTASAVNREKEMKRIESENLAFLKRLQKVKPTKAISRDNQLRAYESTTLHGVPIAALHPMPKSGRRSGMEDSTSSIGGRTRSMTSIHSATSSVRSMGSRQSSRPSSASRRPGSATRHIDRRPQWSDRW